MNSYIEVRAPYIQSVDVKNFIIIKIIFKRQDLHFVCYVNHKGLRNNHLLHEDCIFSSKRKKRYFKHDTIAIALDEYNVFCCCLKQKKTYLICPCPCDTVQWNYSDERQWLSAGYAWHSRPRTTTLSSNLRNGGDESGWAPLISSPEGPRCTLTSKLPRE